jgi:NIPSNAP protein
MHRYRWLIATAVVAAGVYMQHSHAQGDRNVKTRVFEMRTYYAHPGKMEALHARFRDHTCKLFEKHGMTNIGYWSPIDPQAAEQKLVYLLAFPNKEAADKSWKDFRDDPEWKKVREASELNGPLVAKVESVYLNPTDFSAIK